MLQIGGDEGDTTNEWDVDSGLDPGIEEGDKFALLLGFSTS